jgi:hypothetical protein
MLFLTIYFESDDTYTVAPADSKKIRSTSGDEVIVNFGGRSYPGRIIGRSGSFLCRICVFAGILVSDPKKCRLLSW